MRGLCSALGWIKGLFANPFGVFDGMRQRTLGVRQLTQYRGRLVLVKRGQIMGNIINATIDRKSLNMYTNTWRKSEHTYIKCMHPIYIKLRKQLFNWKLHQPSPYGKLVKLIKDPTPNFQVILHSHYISKYVNTLTPHLLFCFFVQIS